MLTYEQFLERVSWAGGLSRGVAARAADAVLRELGASLTWMQTQRVASCLPRRLARAMVESSFGSSMSREVPEVFIAHVADREGVDREEAAGHVRAVGEALRAMLPPVIAAGLAAQLPQLFGTETRGDVETARVRGR